MSRVQLALRVADLEGSIAFYSKLFGAEPAKRRPGYANFAITEPPLKLVLIEGTAGEPTRLDHLGVEVETTDEVTAATSRLAAAGLATATEEDTACCYAVQDKVWVTGPGAEPWEVYVVKGDASTLDKAASSVCCAPADGRTRVPGFLIVAAAPPEHRAVIHDCPPRVSCPETMRHLAVVQDRLRHQAYRRRG